MKALDAMYANNNSKYVLNEILEIREIGRLCNLLGHVKGLQLVSFAL